MQHWYGQSVDPDMRKTPPAHQLAHYRSGGDPRWRCSWCWAYYLVGPDLYRRMGQMRGEHLAVDRFPRAVLDDRFVLLFKNRSFRCDDPDCINGGPASLARIGEWLYDADNRERFRASNLYRDAVYGGRRWQRATFTFQDGGRIHNAQAPYSFPRLSSSQPSDLDNNRLQLWWTGRWKATWFCKSCIAHHYQLPIVEVDDFLHLPCDQRAYSRRLRAQTVDGD